MLIDAQMTDMYIEHQAIEILTNTPKVQIHVNKFTFKRIH